MIKIYLALFCSFLYNVQAQAEPKLTLDEVVRRVQDYSPDLKLKTEDKKIAKLSRREALGTALPQLSGEVRHLQNFQVPKFDIPGMGTFQMLGDFGNEYNVTVSQALYTFGAVAAALSAAEKGLAMVDLDFSATRENVVYQAKVGFYQVLLAKKNLEINQSLLNQAQQNLKILQDNFRGGRPPQGDLIRLQADIENKKPMVINAQAELRATKIALALLMGEDMNFDYDLQGDLPRQSQSYQSDKLSLILKNQAPTLKALEKRVEFQNSLADLEFSSTLPKLGLFFNYNQMEVGFNERFSTDMDLTTSTLGVSLSWNIWDGGISRANYDKAKIEANKAQIELVKTKDNLERQVQTAYEQFSNYQKNLEPLDKAVLLARESFRLSQKRFRAGQTSITELNDNQSLLLQTELQKARNLFQLNMTQALIESLIGQGSPS